METSSSQNNEQDQQKNLNHKYQKLAAEYAKLRSQVQVLKKAVVDEQHQSSLLRDQLATQDQTVRKLDQELDSVKFRNRQLEKRIEILQEPSSTTTTTTTQQQQQFDSNILLHVEQNKQLQESLAQLNDRYSTDVGRLKRKIEQEMVHRDLMDSMKQEHSEKVLLLNKRIKELCNQNSELMDKLAQLELMNSGGGGGQYHGGQRSEEHVDPETSGHNELLQKLVNSEVERERLNSELQILRMKLKRYDIKSPVSPTPITESIPTTNTTTTTTVIGKVEVDGQVDEQLVQEVLRSRITELVKLLQLSDSKSVYYYHEAHNLCRLLRTSQLCYKRLENEFSKLKVKYRNVCDELDDITRGYEQQVNSLTEHIALLNEKLAGMVEEIGVLKKK